MKDIEHVGDITLHDIITAVVQRKTTNDYDALDITVTTSTGRETLITLFLSTNTQVITDSRRGGITL